MGDNMARTFRMRPEQYELNPSNYGFNRKQNIMGGTYLKLKQNNDPRFIKVADPILHFISKRKRSNKLK
jgi:hypothetical protein